MSMYDRTRLRDAAERLGHPNANRLASHLGIPRTTAYRLWDGDGEPGTHLTTLVHDRLGVPPRDLLIPANPETPADAESEPAA